MELESLMSLPLYSDCLFYFSFVHLSIGTSFSTLKTRFLRNLSPHFFLEDACNKGEKWSFVRVVVEPKSANYSRKVPVRVAVNCNTCDNFVFNIL